MELALTLLITIIGAIIGAVLWPLFGRRIQTPTSRMLRASDPEKRIQAVVNFYLDRIDYRERIPPSFLRFYLESGDHSVDRIEDLDTKCKISDTPLHVLLYMEFLGQIIGTMKLIYVCPLQSFFIAYYATKPSGDVTSADILNGIMDLMAPQLLNCTNLYYEICISDENKKSHLAKERLFQHYAQSRGYAVRTLVKNYLQPEVSSFEGGFPDPTEARLYAISKRKECLDLHPPKAVVSELFRHVYLDSFKSVDPSHVEEYKSYLYLVQEMMELPE